MAEVVDLSQDGEHAPASQSQQEHQEDEFGSDFVPMGHFRTEVVGIRYYQGGVNMWEMVILERDHHNAYDENAIKVNNVEGVKVGHISAVQAAVLAPLLDTHKLHIEGVACGPKGKFKLPILVQCFAPPDPNIQGQVERTLFNHGMHLSTADPATLASQSQERLSSPGPGGHKANKQSDSVSKREREEALEKMFEALGVNSEVQDMLKPAKEIASGLYPHQMVALAWMVKRENNNSLPPLWEPREVGGRVSYMNTLTNFSQDTRPPPVRGGILADDMGLGKTLTVIALVATNRPGIDPAALQPYRGSLSTGRPIESGSSSSNSVNDPPAKRHKGSARNGTPTGSQTPGNKKNAKGNASASVEELAAPLEGPPCVPSADGPRATLIICPPSVLSNWQTQVLDHTAGNLKVYAYHGGWALSGTPIQNKLLDLFGLTIFLDFAPLKDRKIFTRSLERPVKEGSKSAIKNLQVLMGNICLRRTKDMRVAGKPLISLPPKTVSIVEVPLTDEDMRKYIRVEELATRVMSGMLEDQGEALLKNYALVLQFLLRLRQICDAGSLVPDNITEILGGVAAQALAADKQQGRSAPKLSPERIKELQDILVAAIDSEECPVCMEQFDSPVITACAHVFCRPCIEQVLKTQAQVAALMHVLKHNHATNQAALAAGGRGPPIKAVVFSQFTSMLDLVGKAMEQEGLAYLRLDGSVSQKARSSSIEQFSSACPTSPTVFLISLKAGGVGLNLTAACQVHLLDPWWNLSIEEQAMDRVHRLGSEREVEVLRYIAKGTIEERMLLLQERKQQLKDAAFKRETATQMRQMRVEDVRLLMRL
ncbi:P-loop containing nucleoside triphosphate hydrolase protein [Dunaliella salina]|uniref:P-loop containing nucleoside triphosphate hydrolase protein n=1 Tax=Dunaliella salina TaxID=3046 RepID=A0ABQ7GTR8_DUNSA|nr:P-loop containing nucleoside triphosphate hydrolase protein [Dunaliella salina]|eukprot:KAF5838000.1 P-loop containing nucleoside triphosphate hydrolase protein [Dunaliella salina]